ncbi:MAG: succinylglutamate desuccinylase/aspartoacylase family protein [Calditrichia bacterium]
MNRSVFGFLIKHWFALASLLFALVLGMVVSFQFRRMYQPEKLFPSAALSRILHLSDYHAALAGSSGDSEIFCFESGKPGGSVLVLGGTHPNEPAGYMTAYLILENLQISRGSVYVIPRANHSAFTYSDPQEGCPQFFTIEGRKGTRQFRYGSRITNPVNQWPDPDIYLHYPSGQKLAGNETRNLNRAYPGRPDGTLTEQIAYSIMEFIKKEKIDLAFDLHEAAPEYPVVNAIVSSKTSQDLVTEAALELTLQDLQYSLEPSPYNFRGLSHREWENFTNAYPVLMETANPIQGRLRGKTDARLILTGQDKMYLHAAGLGVLSVPYDSSGLPLKLRVGRHLEAFKMIVQIFSRNHPERGVEITGLPGYQELMKNGIGFYF